MIDDQQRARELWSDALRKVGQHEYAYHVGCGGDLNPSEQATLDAITAALRAAPAGFGSLSPVDHVRYWAEAYGPQATEPHFQGHGVAAGLLAEYADLLERLAARPQGVK